MFDTILIANRGEIAVRIIRTCKRLGIRTVAVYSDADNRSLHRQLADEAVHIGRAPATESYLNPGKILSAAKDTGSRAVHPGYGFLSENTGFAESVQAAGLTFIGPPSKAIALMGDKIASKALALKAGVPVIPGYAEALKDVDEALSIAREVGYPVLLKPAAGGGGKGMRIVGGPDQMADALAASRQETRKAFGDTGSLWSGISNSPGTWRSRCWQMPSAMSYFWGNGSAPSSGGTRKSSRNPRLPG